MENEIGRSVVDAALTVHKALGPGLLESAYEACLCRELELRNWQVERQVAIPIRYQDIEVDQGYRLDLLINRLVVVEIKSVDRIADVHRAQILSYLKLGDFKLGFLINFNSSRIRDGIQRFVNGLDER
ncbi:MAG: GxxExxY protein [Alphaproteobacteria bacterium]|nr:GxxExxY protein [Alphaproteobacteria bacterium]MBO6861417.1 GxxExxY protein [Alphaproteobacteria bacterium]